MQTFETLFRNKRRNQNLLSGNFVNSWNQKSTVMKTMMIMKWDGATPDQYEQVRKNVNWEGDKPKGAVFHVASFGNNALHVMDIWESQDDFNSFVQNRLMPGVMKAGIQGQPQIELYPVHATYVANAELLMDASLVS
jgi:hypothetical protein